MINDVKEIKQSREREGPQIGRLLFFTKSSSKMSASNKVIFGQRSKRMCETDDADIRAGGEEGPFHAEETINAKVLRQNGTHCV